MKITRRQFSTGVGVSLFGWSSISPAFIKSNTKTEELYYYSARSSWDGKHFVSGFNSKGTSLFDTALPERGHAVTIAPNTKQISVVGRRPGYFLYILDATNGAVLSKISPAKNRHFNGHSFFSVDSRWLYTTETDFEKNRGMIGVRDAHNDFKQVREFASHGLDPHELLFLSDQQTLVVANGGILTQPETERSKLNIETMQPSLAYLNAEDGELLHQYALPQDLHQNSIRHITRDAKDQIFIAMQYEGPVKDFPPLIGVHQQGQSNLRLLAAPQKIQQQMVNYCGSVCLDVSQKYFAVSSPKGGLITFWDAEKLQFVRSLDVFDGCGISAGKKTGDFLISSGDGRVFEMNLADAQNELKIVMQLQASWDNHLVHS